MIKTLITGAAGFIGSELAIKLLERGDIIIGLDNHNDYYDVSLKEQRIKRHLNHDNYTHLRLDISDKASIEKIFFEYRPSRVINLAAQAGVRYSIQNPETYVQSNVNGFLNILEACRCHEIEHLVYASSSSVYGANGKQPFSVNDNVDHPLSIYAATKKTNELMAHVYSHLYELPTTGLRFFTVYGPWGRPDMALFKFTEAILNNQKISVHNFGQHKRDFTYIDDIVEGVIKVLDSPPKPNNNWNEMAPDPGSSIAPWCVYNIGSSNPVELMEFIKAIEISTGKKANIEMLPLQMGDVLETFADVSDLSTRFQYKPSIGIESGIKRFVEWYRRYYNIRK